jgi:hypothetical protein
VIPPVLPSIEPLYSLGLFVFTPGISGEFASDCDTIASSATANSEPIPEFVLWKAPSVNQRQPRLCLSSMSNGGHRGIYSKSYAKRHQGSSGVQARLEPIVRRPRPQCCDLVLCRAHWLVPTPQFIRHRLLEERNPGFHHFFWDMESQYRRLCVPLCQPPK